MAKYAVTRTDGTPIPEDEPYFVIRAKDKFALAAVLEYTIMVWSYISHEMRMELLAHLDRILAWQISHDTKIPD